jgi:hypothetical protein
MHSRLDLAGLLEYSMSSLPSNTKGQIGYVHPQRSWHRDRPAALYKTEKKRPDMSREGGYTQPLGPRGRVINNVDQWVQDMEAIIRALETDHGIYMANAHPMMESNESTTIQRGEFNEVFFDQTRIAW